MVLSFLRAERDSSGYGSLVEDAIQGAWHLLDEPNLYDLTENVLRRKALGAYRGYGEEEYLFVGFPKDVEWWHVQLSHDEIGNLKYGNGVWLPVTEHSRKVRDGARVLESFDLDGVLAAVRAIESRAAEGTRFEPIIIVAEARDHDHVLVEGYKRATAYYRTLESSAEISAFAGYSTAMSGWQFY